MESISEETIVRKILAKLPTKDVLRCRFVSRLWLAIVDSPSFRALHSSGGGGDLAENLLVVFQIFRTASLDMLLHGIPTSRVDMVIHGSPTSTARPMRRITGLPMEAGYSLANACNGFLLVAPRVQEDEDRRPWPVYVCNPVTGERLRLSAPPAVRDEVSSCVYALGFSPSTLQYKLFRLSFPPNDDCYMDVCTLGGDQLWRRHPDRLPYGPAVSPPPPAFMDGKLFLTCGNGILEIDVATEAHRTYRLPEYCEGEKVVALAFDLRGRLCIAVHVVGRRRLYFSVIPLLHLVQDWELRYTFRMDDNGGGSDQPRSAWLNSGDGMLCYRMNGRLFKYDTTNNRPQVGGKLLKWDSITQLPKPNDEENGWNVYGGYRPSLASPHHVLVSRHRHGDFEHSLSAVLRRGKARKKPRF